MFASYKVVTLNEMPSLKTYTSTEQVVTGIKVRAKEPLKWVYIS